MKRVAFQRTVMTEHMLEQCRLAVVASGKGSSGSLLHQAVNRHVNHSNCGRKQPQQALGGSAVQHKACLEQSGAKIHARPRRHDFTPDIV